MKKILLSIALIFSTYSLVTAQCGSRYDINMFSVTGTTGIVYGQNVSASSSTNQTTLTLDFYQPTGDVATARPLIIWAHAGSFIGGSSSDQDVDTLCYRFVRKGYACASINYRLGVTSYDSLGFIYALIRSVQDMKAAVRFFYKDRSTSNTYKIDTNNIFIGGSSAGALMVLHYAFLKRSCQLTQYVSQHTLDSLGGLSGYSGNQCYSEKIKGVINLCGTLGTYGWIEAGDIPFCSMHGTNDNTINYNRGNVLPTFPFHILVADGSRMLYKQAQTVGVQNNFYTWNGADHIPYAGTTATEMAYMDTTVNFVKDYLLQRMGYTCTLSMPANAAYGTANLYTYTNCSGNIQSPCSVTGIANHEFQPVKKIYPNPSNNTIQIDFNQNETHYLQLSDISGRVVKTISSGASTVFIQKENITEGIYFLKVENTKGQTSTFKILFN